MKKIGLFFALFTFFFTGAALAHPPSKIEISYDSPTKTVTATVWHPVSNPKTHYIKKADIGLNGVEVGKLEFSEQESGKSQSLSYVIPAARAGDKVSVEGYCNLSGVLTEEIAIES